MRISIVAAMSENRVIGHKNQLPWHLPADLRHFKNLTTGRTVVMGRKTLQSIGKALPNRRNIILSKQQNFVALANTEYASDLDTAIAMAKEANETELMIIGGEQIFKLALAYCSKIYLTKIAAHIEGDSFFPELDPQQWEVEEQTQAAADAKNNYAMTFLTLRRLTATAATNTVNN